MSHAVSIDLAYMPTESFPEDDEAAVRHHGDAVHGIDYAGMVHTNDKRLVGVTMALLTVMAFVLCAIVVAAVLKGG